MRQERETVKLADMHSPERNVRMHPERQVQELVRSLQQFGQCRDIVLDESGTILAGNGLKEAMERAGYEDATCIRLIGLTEQQKVKFMLADNKTFLLGIEDLDGINAALELLGEDLDVPGYDEDTLRALVETAEDVTERLMQYGTIETDQAASIRDNAARKEAMIEGAGDNENAGAEYEASNEPEQSASAENFVDCPNCGERIWL